MSPPLSCTCPQCRRPFAPTLTCPHCQHAFAAGNGATLDLPAPPVGTQTLSLADAPAGADEPVTLDLPAGVPQGAVTRDLSGGQPAAVVTVDYHAEAPLPEPQAAPIQTGPPTPGLPERIGRYEIRTFVGEGAFGRVYEAYDPQLKRAVALKVAKIDRAGDEQRRKRFLREAEAAANLRHPNIVAVFDAGEEGDLLFIASDFIRGSTLEARLQQGRLDRPTAVRIVRRLAEALAYAHGKKVVHRDVKPANVMLTPDGEPLLMDFGLAALQEQSEKLTQEQAIMGTPLYMSPEQAAGQATAVGPASDQYSLGVLCYEMLAGDTPFADPPLVVMANHLKVDPPPLSRFDRSVPRDLEAVCLKTLEKEPARRYADCSALSEDLVRWERGEPVQARPIGWAGRMLRWSRRNPLPAGLAAAVAAVLVLGVAVSLWFAGQAREETRNALRQYRTAVYMRQISEVLERWRNGDLEGADETLFRCDTDLRGWEWHHLNYLCRTRPLPLKGQEALSFTIDSSKVRSVVFSPDGQRLASTSDDSRMVKVWDAWTGKEFLSFEYHKSAFGKGTASMVFSPDGKRLASGSDGGTAKVWDAQTGQEILSLGHHGGVTSVVFSPDGKRLATACWNGEVNVWDTQTGQSIFSHEPLSMGRNSKVFSLRINSVAFSPDGKRIATASDDETVKVWDASTGTNLLSLKGHSDRVTSVCFSPDGKFLASASYDKTVKLWNAQTGQERLTIKGSSAVVWAVVFSRDGNRIATASEDKSVKVFDALTGQEAISLDGHSGPVRSVCFSPDGKRLASASEDKTVKVWDSLIDPEAFSLNGHSDAVWSVVFSPDGKRIATASEDKTVKLWDAQTGQLSLTFKRHSDVVKSVVFSPDGKRVASASGYKEEDTQPGEGKMVKLRDEKTGQAKVWEAHRGEVKVWDAHSGKEFLTLKGHSGIVTSVVFSPDGERIVSGSDDKTLKLWAADTGTHIWTLKGHTGSITSVAFSADGKRIASASEDNTVKVWNAQTGNETFSIKGHTTRVFSVAFSPDSNRLASACGDVKVWDAQTGQASLTLKVDSGGPVRSVCFSPDGKRIASAEDPFRHERRARHDWKPGVVVWNPGKVKVWDALTGHEILLLRGHSAPVTSVVFSPDGQRLASASADHTVKVWDVPTEQ